MWWLVKEVHAAEMCSFRQGLILAVVIGFLTYSVIFNPFHKFNREIKQIFSTSGDRQILEAANCPLETKKRENAERFMNDKTKYDNPGLIRFMRKYVLEDPDPYGKLSLSTQVYKTTQADKVLEVLKNKRSGFFVEAGAFDGETASNTIYLEQAMNWTGLLIEMDPGFFMQTKGKYRGSVIANACLSPTAHPAKVKIVRNPKNPQATTATKDAKQKVPKIYQALCFPFYSFMLAMGKTEIDYFSLDVEGLEMEVLKTIPFDKLNIKVLTVEYIHSKYEKKAFSTMMKSKGYIMYADLQRCNGFCKDFVFVKRDLLT